MADVLDVFKQDAFGVVALTDAVNKMPFVPGRLGAMKLFTEAGVSVTTAMIEEKEGTLTLVQSQPRGGPANQVNQKKRKTRSIVVPHLPVEDHLRADEVQGVRAFGTDSQLETVAQKVQEKLTDMVGRLDATLEYHRIGAVKGLILDADGATLVDLFTVFGVSQESEIDFDLDNATPASGAVMKKCNEVLRKMEDNMEMGSVQLDAVMALCSSEFFDDLIAHKEVRETWVYQQGERLRDRTARRSVFYGGIVFEEYRGSVGGTAFIAANKAHFFPVGVPGLFKTYFAPADYVETVNTNGLPRYAKQAVDPKFQKFVDIEVQSNPLNLCTRPKVLIKAKRT